MMENVKHSLPYFPLYTSEFIADTQDLTDAEVGAYIRVLMYSWNKGGPVEKKRALRLIDNAKQVWPVLAQFFIENDGMIYNNRLEKERKKSIQKVEAGRKGGSRKPSKSGSETSSETSSENGSRTPSEIEATQTSELITKNKENSELKNSAVTNDHSDSNRGVASKSGELTVLSFFADYPSLNFPSMTIPRLLQIQVLDNYGEKALRYMLDEISKVPDQKKRYSPQYVKAMIQNAPLLKIKNGNADETGQEIRAFTRDEALAWCDRNGSRMDQSFATRKSQAGSVEKFEDGKAKFFLVTPQQIISSFARGAQA